MTVIPNRSTYGPDEPIRIEATDAGSLELWHLDRRVTTTDVRSGVAELEPQPVGGYGVVARSPEGRVLGRTAVDVLTSPFDRPRYGFVADYPVGRAPDALVGTARRLHLNLVQFYDWAHRYAQLVPATDDYVDPLGRRLSLSTVRAMTSALHEVGSLALGYAAVYAVGGQDWPAWKEAGLFTADGQPHRFTDDLLLVVDPANEKWMAHLTADLADAMRQVGFDGFHLDSYGWPKRALRADGTICDVDDAFASLLSRIQRDVPASQHMFNNVNDFPTWATTKAPQSATYIEVWDPHSTLVHLGALAERARAFRPGRPPILAAYLTPYRDAPAERADAAARLTMAAIFSHGATHLLMGEEDRILVDPYYPKNHQAEVATSRMMVDWYDFLVRHGDLLVDPEAVDVTRSYTGGINEDLVVQGPPGVRFSTDGEPGTVWIRVVRTTRGLVVHLINLVDQDEIAWNAPKHPIGAVAGTHLRVLRTLSYSPALVADPEHQPALTPVAAEVDDRYHVYALPPLGAWTVIVLPDPLTWPEQ